jgi:beta-RFAP synthase
LVARLNFPSVWAVVLFTPAVGPAWHGGHEHQAFARLKAAGPSPAETEALCRLILTGLLPALASEDLETFGEAVYELNARAGDAFAAAQGGRYAGPAVAALIGRLRAAGIRGVGQSSWGPTVFAITSSVLATCPE